MDITNRKLGGIVGRPRMYDETLRERLIEEAQKMLAEDGYHGVSLRVLTRNVGTSTNAVYTLFGSKEALMAEVVVRDLDSMLAAGASPHATEDVRADIIRMARHYRAHATRDPRTFSGAFEAMEEAQRPGSLTDRINPEVKNISSRLYQPLLELCERVAEHYPGTQLDPQEMALALWALIHGFIDLENTGTLVVPSAEIDAAFDRAVHALYLGWVATDPEVLNTTFDSHGKPVVSE